MSFLPSGATQSAPSAIEAVEAATEWLDEATDSATRLRVPLRIEVVRPLTAADISGGFCEAAPPPTLREIKASHHNLAKIIAAGRSVTEASRITGYSPAYISRLRGDPAFASLVSHYSEVEELAATDFLGSMRAVGMDLLDELRRRVEDDPRVLTTAQLHDGIKLLLVEPMKAEAARAGGLGGAAVAPIQISFVASPTPQAGRVEDGRIIEGDAREVR